MMMMIKIMHPLDTVISRVETPVHSDTTKQKLSTVPSTHAQTKSKSKRTGNNPKKRKFSGRCP